MPVRSDLHVIPRGPLFEHHGGALAPELMEEITRVILAWMDSL